MSVVVDTSVLVELLRGERAAADALAGSIAGGETVCASEVTRVELLAGRPPRQERRLLRLFDALEWVPVDERVAIEAGALMRRYASSHSGIGLADYLIAATVRVLDAELWTLNARHFPMLPRLAPPF